MGRHTTKAGQSSRARTRPPLPFPVADGRLAPAAREALTRRAHRRGSRMAALSAASMLALGGTAAGMTIAGAEEPEAARSGEIVFSGGCGTLGVLAPSSRPDASEVTVAEGSQVKYTNDLGVGADLHVGGEVYDVAAGTTQVIAMHHSAEIAMVPECHGLFADYGSAKVTVVAGPVAEGEPELPEDSGPSTAALPSPGESSGQSTGSASGGDSGGAASADEAPTGTAPQGASGSFEGPADGGPRGPRAEATTTPSAEREADSFGGSGSDTPDSDIGLEPASDEVAAIDPEAVSDGASGLLALVAIVCLVGVGAAAMRTIMRWRAPV